MSFAFDNMPAPPDRESWGFLRDLQEPLVWRTAADRTAPPADGELDLRSGLTLHEGDFADDVWLATALESLRDCLRQTGLAAVASDGVPLRLWRETGLAREHYRIEVTAAGIVLVAGETEGMRRAICQFQGQLCAAPRLALPMATTAQAPWLTHRISRCFFGPIKRPPYNRDELLDDIDYYPAAYLDRLAHEGINGLWLTIVFRELAQTSFAPADPQAPQRLRKLRATVEACRRYGIRIWLFCIEPRALFADDPLLQAHPEWQGPRSYAGSYHFCPSSPSARRYLYESARDIFTQVPGLGGIINISHGERPTSCLSSCRAIDDHPIDCPRCRDIPKWQIHANAMAPILDGMRAGAPEADLISWFYQPQPVQERGEWVYELARNVPPGVILQYNFESGCCKVQLSRPRLGGDYWLSCIGPSQSFARVAENAAHRDTPLAAKIQVGCSHEVATVPFVPVPGLLYQKYAAMRRAGCRHVMQCWYFGNYPGVMNQAAGALAFHPFGGSEEEFLLQLAQPHWGAQAATVARAWKLFSAAYAHYPLANNIQYYGPMQFGPVWPLHLQVRLLPLAPTWKPDFPPSGDTIGECLINHTLEEALLLSERMADTWDEGVNLLRQIAPAVAGDRERERDIGVAAALGLQFRSAARIFRFYLRRRQLHGRHCPDRAALLADMRQLVLDEQAGSAALSHLAAADSRLGFHSEAEAHLYSPARLHWRIAQLDDLLANDFPAFSAAIAAGRPLPESPLQSIAPRYRIGSGWIDAGSIRWRLDRHPDGSLRCRVRLDGVHQPDDILVVSCTDATGSRYPWIITSTAAGTFHEAHGLAIGTIERADSHWNADILLPALGWEENPDLAPVYIHLQRHVQMADAGASGSRYASWPPRAESPRHRLNLFSYQGCAGGRLID